MSDIPSEDPASLADDLAIGELPPREQAIIERTGQDPVSPGPPDACTERTPHPPIRITQDHGPQGFTWTNPVTGEREPRPGSGVVGGSGTEADPFVIAGWCLVVPIDIAEAGVSDPVPALLIDGTDSHLVIRNNTVAGSQEEGAGLVLWYVENVLIEGNRMTGARVGAFVGHSTDVVFASNVAEGNRDGIYVWHSPNPVVEDNIVRNNTRYGIAVTGLGARPVVGGNTAVNNSVGLEVKGYNAQVTRNVADGNRVDLRVSASSGARVVDNRFGTGLVMLGFEPFDSGQEIRNNTVDGEPVVYIEGADAPEIPERVGQLILANVTNATVQGLDIAGAAVGIQVSHSRNVEMRNNTIAGGQRGIDVARSEQVRIHGNDFPGVSGEGVKVQWSPPLSVRNNTVADSATGIRVSGVFGPCIEPCAVTIADNAVTGNDIGIRAVAFGDGLVVQNNTVVGNDQGIQADEVKNAIIQDNTVAANGEGIILELSDGLLRRNAVTDNDRGIRVLHSPARGRHLVEVHENNIAGNTIGLDLEDSLVNATRNWWGHPTGPSAGAWDPCEVAPATGLGDAIRPAGGIVCFHPWLVEPHPEADGG